MDEQAPAPARAPALGDGPPWAGGNRAGKTLPSSAATTIRALLDRAAKSPHGVTVIDRDLREQRLRYEDLSLCAAHGARALRGRGITPGDRVCLISPTSTDLIAAVFSVWVARGVPIVLPLPRRQKDLPTYLSELSARITTVTPAAVLVADSLLKLGLRFDHFPVPVVSFSDLQCGSETGGKLVDRCQPDEIALIQFTSGTTQSSRAVTLSHEQIIAHLRAVAAALDVDPAADVGVSWLPLYHDMGMIGGLLGAVWASVPLVLLPPEEFLARPGVWLDAISAYGGTMTASPNFGFALAARDLMAHPRALNLTQVRAAITGSEAVDIHTIDGFITATEPYGFSPQAIAPMYGLAECTLAVTASRLDSRPEATWISHDALEMEGQARVARPRERRKAVVPCGWPIAGTTVAIVDEAGDPVPERHVGEICVRSASVMSGYWRDSDATADVLRDGWLHTGDLGFWSDEGLVICGRAKDMIIIGGRNLYPEDYEWYAEHIPGIRRGNVIAFAIPELERMVVVAETAAPVPEAHAIAQTALETLQQRLARAPEEVVLIPAGNLPKTTSGKRQRSLCRSLYRAGELPVVATAGKAS